ncbi:MAG: DHH family phosphoesterase [Nitrososphaerota archaeon]|nr:DHH family phosphoesterase [Nitrososphaerota archaeon]
MVASEAATTPERRSDQGALFERARDEARHLLDLSRKGARVLVVTHIDADGLSSGSIAFSALARKGVAVSVRAIPDLDLKAIERLRADKFDFYLFTDLGSGLLGELSKAFGERFAVLDHHQVPEADLRHPRLINAWNFGYDGGVEACSSTMAYAFAKALDDWENADLSQLAIVGALGDRQDKGEGRMLTGLNKVALDDAVSRGLVSATNDLLFFGRETRPVHEAVAMSYTPFIQGLSGAKDAALAALTTSGLRLKEGGRWRTLGELSNEEKQKVVEVVSGFIASAGHGADVLKDLLGTVYTFVFEDPLTPLRDAREFSSVLNACGRMDRADLGVSICIGDRESALSSALSLMAEYRSKLNKALQRLQQEEDKVATQGNVMVVMGEEFIEERMTGSVSSLLASSDRFRDKLVLVRARSGESDLKFSSRIGDSFPGKVNLGEVMRAAAESVGGVGGGHSMAAGAKVPFARRDEFTRLVVERVAAG